MCSIRCRIASRRECHGSAKLQVVRVIERFLYTGLCDRERSIASAEFPIMAMRAVST